MTATGGSSGAQMSEREDLKARIDIVLENLAVDMDGWRRSGLAPNSTLAEARELAEEATWEKQDDLADRLSSAIQHAEREIAQGRPG